MSINKPSNALIEIQAQEISKPFPVVAEILISLQ